ncbi:muts domain V-domain-containing protein [Schizothecium vesticola]|uniref:Muts domain V-domain-containing protein n=1 Tax=Schizothecium vesticola TaxID=314040 RepID=A0AA40FAQ6_9PEZI|nr:muts domain V-domain-containing protein [Schizothecium vesticola]
MTFLQHQQSWALLPAYLMKSTVFTVPVLATVARSAANDFSTAAWSRRRPLLALGAQAQTPFPVQIRGKKMRTTVKLQDLPQGPLGAPLEPLDDGDHEPAYPTVVMQARRNMQKFDGCVVLTRVGGFYELYFEHADEYGPLLNLKVAQKKTNGGPVSMAGFPFFQLDRFLKILVQDLHRHVAISEEFPNDASGKVKSGGLMHDRRVARIVTPGTLIDEKFMDPYANNYVMAIHLPPRREQETEHDAVGSAPDAVPVPDAEAVRRPTADTSSEIGLAWLDVSTGHFFTQPTSLSSLGSVLSRVSPREVVLDKQFESQQDRATLSLLEEEGYIVTYSPQGELETLSDWEPMLESEVPPEAADQFTENEVRAGSILLNYVKDRLRGLSMKLQPPLRYDGLEVMKIDRNTMRSLEIKKTVKDGIFKGSLLHAIRRTVTSGGARLLHQWLSAPSTSLEVIHARQDLVSCFLRDQDLCEGITTLLRRSHDSYRLVQKFALNRGDPDDLLGLASTIRATEDIVGHLRDCLDSQDPSSRDSLAALLGRISLDEPLKLAKRIRKSIDEEGLDQRHQLEDSETGEMIALAQEVVKAEGTEADSALLPKGATAKSTKRPPKTPSLRDHYGHDTEAWIMKPDASAALSRLHADVAALRVDKDLLTDTLRTRLEASSLTLRWSPSLGHICHVKGKDARRDPATHTLSSSRTTRSFHDPSWTALGERLDSTRHRIRTEEQKVFAALRALVLRSLVKLRRNASVLDALDIATSFARLAREHTLVRPVLHDTPGSLSTIIKGGRHPTVEPNLPGRPFQRNDCLVGAPGHGRAWLITGPNMAGKSTFLRQNALIAILAQVGCYVPADHASLAVIDAVHTRVGSADDLSRHQSTFLVEMLETAAILRGATPRSLVVMDEVGRGTTPGDGEAVAFAALWHLVHVNRCRVLFATHFHGIADLVAAHGMRVEDGGEVDMYCTDVEEDGEGGFVYVHKLRRGVNRNSHALKVARLAGLPGQAIEIARRVLEGRTEGAPGDGDGAAGEA